MRPSLAAGLLWYLGSGCSAPSAQVREAHREPDDDPACRMERIADGDTFYCAGGEKVRLIGIDAPELDQGDLGRRSREALDRMIPPGTDLRLELDVRMKDRYGRTLAYVWKDSGMVNEQMVRQGWALQYTVPPDVRYAERFRLAERAARSEQVGLWAEEGFECAPIEHRRGHC